VLLPFAFIASCENSKTIEPNQDKAVLFERFHGKYKVVNCTSNIPVDLNKDGTSSLDLTPEIDLQNSGLELRITSQFFLIQNWPEAYLQYGVPDSSVNCANQGLSEHLILTGKYGGLFSNLTVNRPTSKGFRCQNQCRSNQTII
jgi:hypothetical protein